MKNKSLLALASLALTLALIPTVHATEQQTMSPEMQAQMAKMKEATTPGAEHAILNSLEGKWKVTTRAWMAPGAAPEESTGKSTMSWVLDGHFLKQSFVGKWMDNRFEGIGLIGYDKIKKQYTSYWMDSMSTGTLESTGKYNTAKKTISGTGTFSCPMTGEKNKWFRDEWSFVSQDKNVYTVFMKDANGREFKSMEITYER